MTIKNTFPATSDYLKAGSSLVFTLNGFTNPAGTTAQYFTWRSYATISSTDYQIDELSTTISISAVQGTCDIVKFYPTDNNRWIYGAAESWLLRMSCTHAIDASYGVSITFVKDNGFYIKKTPKCTVVSTNEYYACSASNTDSLITVMKFSSTPILAKGIIEFTVDSIINPGWEDYKPYVTISTISDSGNVIDTGIF